MDSSQISVRYFVSLEAMEEVTHTKCETESVYLLHEKRETGKEQRNFTIICNKHAKLSLSFMYKCIQTHKRNTRTSIKVRNRQITKKKDTQSINMW